MAEIHVSDLAANAKTQTARGDLITKSSGVADRHILGPFPYDLDLVTLGAVVTTTLDTAGCTISFGSVSSVGAYGSVTLSSTQAIGEAVITTAPTVSRLRANNVMVVDVSSASGAGVFVPIVTFQPVES